MPWREGRSREKSRALNQAAWRNGLVRKHFSSSWRSKERIAKSSLTLALRERGALRGRIDVISKWEADDGVRGIHRLNPQLLWRQRAERELLSPCILNVWLKEVSPVWFSEKDTLARRTWKKFSTSLERKSQRTNSTVSYILPSAMIKIAGVKSNDKINFKEFCDFFYISKLD